jgi:F0F1-type ATP synthase epsilon subunit
MDEAKKPDIEKGKNEVALDESKLLHIKIYAPYKVYYDSIAYSISATNDKGLFDILPKHHNFITLLNKGEIIVRNDKGEETFSIERGIMHVKESRVIVFLDV